MASVRLDGGIAHEHAPAIQLGLHIGWHLRHRQVRRLEPQRAQRVFHRGLVHDLGDRAIERRHHLFRQTAGTEQPGPIGQVEVLEARLLIVGVSGSSAERFADVMTSARALPLVTLDRAPATSTNAMVMVPAITSVMACGVAR